MKLNFKALVLTAHFVTPTFELKNYTISVKNIADSNSDTIVQSWSSSIKKYNIEKLTSFTVDGGSDMVTSGRKIEKNTLWCVCHRLHLITTQLYEFESLKVLKINAISFITIQ